LTIVTRPGDLEVEVIKAVRAPVTPSFVRAVIRRAASLPEVAARLPGAGCTLAVRVTSDDELRELHRDFSGDDSVTDVLSFTGVEGHLGDLAISWPAAVRQAEQFGHPVDTELALLGVHGLLHLLGWDHGTVAEHVEMTRITLAALRLSGLRLARGRL
jgi:probable rRNA maturation factor